MALAAAWRNGRALVLGAALFTGASVSAAPPDALPPADATAAPPACRVDAGLVTLSQPMTDQVPVLVLFERDPWGTAIGSDFPAVALYASGRIVFVRGEGRQAKAMRGEIGAAAAARLRDEIAASGFLDAPLRTDCSDASDQVSVDILLRRGESWKVASAYGIGRDGTCRVTPAKAFVDAYARLLKAGPDDAQPFAPDALDVMLWDFEHSQQEPLPWPKELPAPPATVVPEFHAPYDPKVYHHVLPGRFKPDIDRLLDALNASNPSRAVLLNGHKWTVSPAWLWPGERAVESAIRCAHGGDEVPDDGE